MAKSSGILQQPQRSEGPPRAFIDVETLRNADNLISIISLRRNTGVFTFALFKEFERDGKMERTGFIPDTLAQSFVELAQLTIKRIMELKRDGVSGIKAEQIAGRATTNGE